MFWLLGGKRGARLLVVPMIGLVFGGILLSLSRGALVGLVAGLIFLLITDRRRVQLALVAAAVAFVAAALLVHSNPQRFQSALFAKQQIAQENVHDAPRGVERGRAGSRPTTRSSASGRATSSSTTSADRPAAGDAHPHRRRTTPTSTSPPSSG